LTDAGDLATLLAQMRDSNAKRHLHIADASHDQEKLQGFK